MQAVQNGVQDAKEAAMGAGAQLKDAVTGRPTVSTEAISILDTAGTWYGRALRLPWHHKRHQQSETDYESSITAT